MGLACFIKDVRTLGFKAAEMLSEKRHAIVQGKRVYVYTDAHGGAWRAGERTPANAKAFWDRLAGKGFTHVALVFIGRHGRHHEPDPIGPDHACYFASIDEAAKTDRHCFRESEVSTGWRLSAARLNAVLQGA